MTESMFAKNDEEIQKEVTRLNEQKQRQLWKIQDWQAQIKAWTLDQKVYADFISLFNDLSEFFIIKYQTLLSANQSSNNQNNQQNNRRFEQQIDT